MNQGRLKNILIDLIVSANTELRSDVVEELKKASLKETRPNGKKALEMLLKNIEIASSEKLPMCQDTGYVDFYFHWPSRLALVSNLQQLADEAVASAYTQNNYRCSMVKDPVFNRQNTQNNTPCSVNLKIVEEKDLKITVMLKGAGSDNSSAVMMLNPLSSEEEIVEIAKNHIIEKAPKSCPPIIVGIGLGSSFNKVAALSKEVLLRNINEKNQNSKYAALEERILSAINKSKIGASGLGGDTTALAVLINEAPCHMATLPMAININCYALRCATKTLEVEV